MQLHSSYQEELAHHYTLLNVQAQMSTAKCFMQVIFICALLQYFAVKDGQRGFPLLSIVLLGVFSQLSDSLLQIFSNWKW